MTVSTFKRVVALVEELGILNVDSVYQYTNIAGNPENYTVFMNKERVDIFDIPWVRDPVLVFHEGGWLI